MQSKFEIIPTGTATAILPWGDKKAKPITIIGTKKIRDSIETGSLQQAINTRSAPGVSDLVINPDVHQGYGAPIGCVLVSPTHICPGPVGVDIKCSMSLIQFDLPEDFINEKRIRRELITAITERIPTGVGTGQRSVTKSRRISTELAVQAVVEGASVSVCQKIGIPVHWAQRCEDPSHRSHDGTIEGLKKRLDFLRHEVFENLDEKLDQLGSYGGGNHFGECEVIKLAGLEKDRKTAKVFGLKDSAVAFFSHCGSRGFGNILATNQFKLFQHSFTKHRIPFPANDRHLVYAPLGSSEADDYLDDMALAANFATVNHLLINALVLEAFQEVVPGVQGELVYLISHNIARKEMLGNREVWVHRKGATRAYPAHHPALSNTPFFKFGHPVLLPGDPISGSVVMVADAGAEKSCFSVNHGAGRQIGRRAAFRELDQLRVDNLFKENDILTNCRKYPRDEAPEAYKDFSEVVKSVEQAGLAHTIARLKARFVIKDSTGADD